MLAYDEPQGWRECQNLIDELFHQTVNELAVESSMERDEVRASIEEMHATPSCITHRVFVIAELTS